MNNRAALRGFVLTEDNRTERFIRRLLEVLGCDIRRFRFERPPDGSGAAEAWVRRRYPQKVKLLRSKNFQRLCLLAVRDGDSVGVDARKDELDDELRQVGMSPRGLQERIATPVPTWQIENWLLDLLAHPEIDESEAWKKVFEQEYAHDESAAMSSAARAWSGAQARLPSLGDGRVELARLDQ